MNPSILMFIAAFAGQASAADNELSFELGAFGTADERFDMFDESATIGTLGVRGAFAVHDRVNIVAGYHTGAWGQDVVTEGGDDSYYYYDECYSYDYYSYR